MIDEVYNTTEIPATANTDTGLQITGVKGTVVEALRNAIDIATAKADTHVIKGTKDSVETHVLTKKAKDGLSQTAAR